jgi:hypothetical protein
MQAADDTNFEIEVKFESGVSEGFQMQGILVQGDPPDEVDPQNFLRFEFYSNGLQTFGFSAILQPGVTVEFSSTKTYDMPLYDNNTSPLWMRVRRQGDRWSMLHSADGIQWQGAAAFDHPLEVQSVGTFGGNGGGKTPAHVAKVDYFFNTASPIDPEDGSGDPLTITPSPPGSGTVTQDPPGPTYGCDQEVTLTPNPAPGYQFDRWGGPDGGDVVQQAGEWVITMDGPKEVTAFFVQGGYTLEMLQPLGQGQVTPDVGVYTYQEDEVVTLVAVPDSGWDFDGWYEADGQTPHPDVANDKLATTTLAMDGDKEIRARFVGEPTEWWIYVPLAVNSY